LRQDQRRLEELKRERHEEIREGDRGEARDYNAKIREQEKDIRRDRKNLKDEERERHGKGYHDHDYFLGRFLLERRASRKMLPIREHRASFCFVAPDNGVAELE